MPLVQDYDNEDEDQGSGSGGHKIAAASGVQLAGISPQKEGEAVPWDRFVSANQDVSNREAGKLKSQVQNDAQTATSGIDAASTRDQNEVGSNYLGYQPKGQAQAPASGPAIVNGTIKAPNQPQNSARASAAGSSFNQQGSMGVQQQPAQVSPSAQRRDDMRAGMASRLSAQVAPQVDPDRIKTEALSGGGTKSTPGTLAGSPDLESMLGQNAWGQLLGDVTRANQEGHAVGSEGGVQGMLQQNSVAPNSAFDAALINGQGGKDFRDLYNQYGAGQLGQSLVGADQAAIDRWQKLVGDVNTAASARDASIAAANAPAPAAAGAQPGDQNSALQQQEEYLTQHFPIPPQFQSPQGLLDFINQHSQGSTQNSTLQSWVDQIYGAYPSNPQHFYTQFYQDIERMTPQEYQAFLYGVVPAWMGEGTSASGGAGGSFWGLGNTGNRVTATTTDDPSGLSPDDQTDWNNKQTALKTYFTILQAVMSAAAAAG